MSLVFIPNGIGYYNGFKLKGVCIEISVWGPLALVMASRFREHTAHALSLPLSFFLLQSPNQHIASWDRYAHCSWPLCGPGWPHHARIYSLYIPTYPHTQYPMSNHVRGIWIYVLACATLLNAQNLYVYIFKKKIHTQI